MGTTENVKLPYLLFLGTRRHKSAGLTEIAQRISGQGLIQEALESHICAFLFPADTSKQAQMPVILRTTPNKSEIASPAPSASTTGSTKSNEMRTKSSCVETEVNMLGS